MKWIRIGASVDPGEKLPHERDGDGLRKNRIKFSLMIKKTSVAGPIWVWLMVYFTPKVKYRCFLMKCGEEMRSVLNISRAQDKEKI